VHITAVDHGAECLRYVPGLLAEEVYLVAVVGVFGGFRDLIH
jgi:hypothetical protein